MKTTLKMLALAATLIGFASCCSSSAPSSAGGETSYVDPGVIIGSGK